MENAFCKMCFTVRGKFVPGEGVVAGCDNRIRNKSPAKWSVQIAGMILGQALGYLQTEHEKNNSHAPFVSMVKMKYLLSGFLFPHMPCQADAGRVVLFGEPVAVIGNPVHNAQLACLPGNGSFVSFRRLLCFHRGVYLVISENISSGTPDTEIAVRARICFPLSWQLQDRHVLPCIPPRSQASIWS